MLHFFRMKNQPIGIFDSGVGGLSILLEAQKKLPNESFIYLADEAYLPYGEKTPSQLVTRVKKIIDFLQQQRCKAVIIACNTATVYTLATMREIFTLPIIGTVPPIKTLAKVTRTQCAAVLATPATISSPYLETLINQFASNLTITKISGQGLEKLVENGDLDGPAVKAMLSPLLDECLQKNVDTIALGCTHYPFLTPTMQTLCHHQIAFIDSGEAIARRLADIIQNQTSHQAQSTRFYTTGDTGSFKAIAEKLTQQSIVVSSTSLDQTPSRE